MVLVPGDTTWYRTTGCDAITRSSSAESGIIWYHMTEGNLVHIGLLIRGFGVRVPGGAQLIMALTWQFMPDQSLIFASTLDIWVIDG
jgi:hypothetical protein